MLHPKGVEQAEFFFRAMEKLKYVLTTIHRILKNESNKVIYRLVHLTPNGQRRARDHQLAHNKII